MKKLLLALGLLLLSAPSFAEWESVGADENGDTIYIDPSTIKKLSDDKVKVWVMIDYAKAPDLSDDEQYLSVKGIEYFDCDNEMSAVIFAAGYSGKMGSGSRRFRNDLPESYKHIILGTIGDQKLAIACH